MCQRGPLPKKGDVAGQWNVLLAGDLSSPGWQASRIGKSKLKESSRFARHPGETLTKGSVWARALAEMASSMPLKRPTGCPCDSTLEGS